MLIYMNILPFVKSGICKAFDYVLSSIDRSIRKQGVRIFRHFDDGIVTITIINDIGDEI